MEERKEAGRGKTVGAVCTASGIIVLLYGIVTAFLMNFNSGIVMVLLPGGALRRRERFMQGGENMPCSARFCGQRRR